MTAQDTAPLPGFVRPPADQPVHEITPGRPLIVAAAGAQTGEAFGVIAEVVPPGEGPPPHIHHAADELFYVLAGAFTFQIGDLRAGGGAGTVAFAPRGKAHTWQNAGDGPARMLFVLAPAGFERFLVEVSALPADSLTMEAVNALAAPYQTTYVGPPLAALPE